MQRLAAGAARPASRQSRLLIWSLGAFFSFALSVAAWDFVTGLLARNTLLGGLAFALLLAAVLALLLAGLREWAGYRRLARLDHLRMKAETARADGDLKTARAVTAALGSLYARRDETAWGRARIAERQGEILDADALLALFENEIMAPLDARARAEIESAAARVATVTALVPLALADAATALFANLRMIRRIAEIYGGRSGVFGSWKLLRQVFAAILASGTMALTDDLIGSVAGGGILSKLSRRFGEGLVNGALTARIGLSAMELCRPLPFAALDPPSTTGLITRALAGILPRKD